jgi:hypothetical protein
MLKHLEALEITYAEMLERTDDNRWQMLLNFSFEAKDVDPSRTDWSIVKVRQRFSERSKNIIIVSTQLLNIPEEC